MTDKENLTARLATLDELKKTTLPAFICPIPTDETLRTWFDAAGIPRLKTNPAAKRGGGPVYYSVAGIEKFFRGRMLSRNITSRTIREAA